MLFNSWIFVGFLVVVFATYYAIAKLGLNHRYQIWTLFLASLIFYAYETPSLVFLLLVSLAINAGISRAIVLSAERHGAGVRWLWIGVTVNLAILGFFKYASLIAGLIIPDGYLTALQADLASIPLPVGISFYTFQAISLIVDLNRRGVVGVENLEQQFSSGQTGKGFLNIAFYIAFFPQLVAGPIVKAHDFIRQIGPKHVEDINWDIVVRNLITGYFLKMVIADNLKDVTYLLNAGGLDLLGRVDLIALLYGYSFQIFADFAGYSLIAIGLGAMFGYTFPVNFNFPYISASITEFWRRWHISLSSFLREYLYIPLGGNRKGKLRTYVNLFIVMFLGGLWHGAAWSYAIWGMSHGVLLAIEKLTADLRGKKAVRTGGGFIQVLQILITFHIASLLWLLFLMPDFSQVIEYFRVLTTTPNTLSSMQNVFIVLVYGSPVIAYHLLAYAREHSTSVLPGYVRLHAHAAALSAMLCLIILNSGTAGEFIYFQF